MAKKKKIVTRRKVETVRQRADKEQAKKGKEPRRRKVAAAATKPVKGASKVLKKEYHPIKLPDNKAGRFLTKKRSWIPSYFRESGQELKKVTWPTKRQAASLTFTVIVFSVGIAVIVKIMDFGYDKIFKQFILK